MVVHLDTSFLVDLLREQARRTDGPATRWLEAEADSALAVSLFVRCELEAGAANAAQPGREREKLRTLLSSIETVMPSETFAARYGELLALIQRSSRSISTMDLLIATAAVDAGAALVTANRRHFDVVPGLQVLAHR